MKRRTHEESPAKSAAEAVFDPGRADNVGEQIERAVDEAIGRGDFDEASRICAGHPSSAKHGELMIRIHNARSGTAKGESDAWGSVVDASFPPTIGRPNAFRLSRARAKLTHLNVRAEKHGAEPVTCCDVKFETNQPGEVLAMFSPALRGLLFYKSSDPQDLADQAHEAPNLRMPDLEPLTWRRKLVGAKVTVHYGIDDRSAIVLDGCTVEGFELAPQEGGTVIVTLKAKATRPDADDIGKLAMQVKHEVEVSVEPPADGWYVEPDEGKDDDDEREPFAGA